MQNSDKEIRLEDGPDDRDVARLRTTLRRRQPRRAVPLAVRAAERDMRRTDREKAGV
jgi:hypothetical protein